VTARTPSFASISSGSPRAHARDTPAFSYDEAFSRNLGWVTAGEQRALRDKRVAIAGLGGVGGVHLITLARLGIGRFRLADFDRFDVANFNRQHGATMSTIGKPKIDVLAAMARDVNPDVELELFDEGVTATNVGRFVAGVDLYVDGLDFFAFDARERTFAACFAAGVPATTVAPLGMGAALLNFLPGRMSFEQYFRLDGVDEGEKMVRFLIGLAPALLQRGYVADRSYVDFANRKGPSTAMACQLCAGIAATEALKILLGRGRVDAAPVGLQFDAYRGKLARTWRPWGNRNPLSRIAIAIARRQLAAMGRAGAANPPS
jgi:molybdopterin/thiamine biosynthesis adenylyltransferase